MWVAADRRLSGCTCLHEAAGQHFTSCSCCAHPSLSPSHLPVQLFVLFGLPALVLILSYAFNDPKALMISLPLLMLIPGIR